ncbi:MAG: hypothetical protein OER90_11865 [Gemmatimonadota bacterium]|nr:hypothetical protein [Gemmatimonadota bacterium]
MSDAPATQCVLCGEAEPLGLAVCPACGGIAQAVSDTLIFVKPTETGHDKRRTRDALEPLLAGRAHRAERDLVAAGHRALIRVPGNAAPAVVQRLAHHEVPAVARAARTVWTSAPLPFYLLLSSIVLVGLWAGRMSDPLLLWTSPLMALLLLLAAHVRMRDPAIPSPRGRSVLPRPLNKLAITTLSRLPDDETRTFLANLVRSAEPVYRALKHTSVAGARAADVEQLVTLACRAAVDLSDLDKGLALVGDDPGLERAIELRDRLAQRFRQGIGVLHKLRAETVDADPVRAELAELVEALDAEAEAFAAARQEMSSLLEGTQSVGAGEAEG